MNQTRRKALVEIQDRLAAVQGDLEMLRDEEQEYIDNMPDGMQGGEKATTAQSAVSSIDDAINSLDDACGSVDEATGS